MRPKKKVLVFSEDQDELGRVGYVLWTRHFEPVLASTGKLALMALANTEFHCALVFAGSDPRVAEAVLAALEGAAPGLPLAIYALPGVSVRHKLLARTRCSRDAAVMIEDVKAMCVRRRGPATKHVYTANMASVESNLQRTG